MRSPTLASLAVGGIFSAVGVVCMTVFWPYTMDDSYITLRYAENAVRYGAFVYNAVGPRAEGYTSLLWTLLMTLPHLFGVPAVAFAKLLGFASLVGAGVFAFRLARRMGTPDGGDQTWVAWGVPMWMLAFAPSSVHAVSGMETAFFTLTLTVFLFALHDAVAVQGTSHLRVVFLGLLLGLTRPEGNAVALLGYAALFTFGAPAARRHLALQVLGVHGLLFGAYFLWRATYYGAFWPLPFYLKVSHVAGWAGAASVGNYLIAALAPLAPGIALGIWVDRHSGHRNRGVWAVGMCLLLVWCLFLRPAHVMGVEHRFLYPTFPGLCAVAAAGLERFLGAHGTKSAFRLGAVIACALMPVVVFARSFKESHNQALWYAGALSQAHQALANDLLTAAGSQPAARCRLAIGDAGLVPYVSHWETLDTFGLNDFQIATTYNHSAEHIARFDPHVWVLLSSSAEQFEPLLEWEREAFQVAEARGYDFSRRLKFGDRYYLWVGQVPNAAGCRLP